MLKIGVRIDLRSSDRGMTQHFLHRAYRHAPPTRIARQMVYGRDVKYVLLTHVGAFDAKMLPEL